MGRILIERMTPTPYHRPLLAEPPNPDADDNCVPWEGALEAAPDLNPWCEEWVELVDGNNDAAHGPGCWFPWHGTVSLGAQAVANWKRLADLEEKYGCEVKS
jgi:hypothetical protein